MRTNLPSSIPPSNLPAQGKPVAAQASVWAIAVYRIGQWYRRLNEWLASYYHLCQRVDLASSLVDTQPLQLPADSVMRLNRHSLARQLEVRQGTVWLTGTPAECDVLLQAGERFDFGNHWPYLIQAIGNAEVLLQSDQPTSKTK